MLALELFIVAILTILNGLFALSELAVVSSRRSRLQTMANQGVPGAATALTLAGDPGKFLSVVQIGITLIGVLSGAFSGSTLGVRLAGWLADLGLPSAYADPIGIGVVVVAITYMSVIIGELVPKQLALRDPERFAVMVAPAMSTVARIARPLVVFFDHSGRFILRLMGLESERDTSITDEEIRALIAEAETAGVIEPEERSMIAGVMRLGDRPVSAVMTPRRNVEMIDLNLEPEEIFRRLRASRHSRLPAYRESNTRVVGIIQAKDLADAYIAGEAVDPRDFVKPAPNVPETIQALDVLDILKGSSMHVALVHDEYGDFQGLVTSSNILEAIAGVFQTQGTPKKTHATRRKDGGWFLDGAMPIDEAADLLGLKLPEDREYHTLAGYLLGEFGRLPAVAEDIVRQNWRFEVVDLDGRRIDKVLAKRTAARRRTKVEKPKAG
jgi:putative hemolysin